MHLIRKIAADVGEVEFHTVALGRHVDPVYIVGAAIMDHCRYGAAGDAEDRAVRHGPVRIEPAVADDVADPVPMYPESRGFLLHLHDRRIEKSLCHGAT